MPIQMQMTLPDLPKNYEYTGEIRRLAYGDLYLEGVATVKQWIEPCRSDSLYPILRKKKKTRPPVPGDIKDIPIPCRMSNDGFEWTDGYLVCVMPWNTCSYGVYKDRMAALCDPRRFDMYRHCVIEVDE